MAKLKSEFHRQKLALPEPAVTAMSLLLRLELIATNAFLTVMYGSVLRFGSVPRFLRVLPIELPTGIPIGMVRLKNRTHAPSAQVFIDATRELVRPMRSLNAKQLRREMR
jgi:DNA-binding transcriptional LysR family regulator